LIDFFFDSTKSNGLLKSIFIHIEGKEESKEYMKAVEFKSNSRKQLAQRFEMPVHLA
jgi:hypothetical protein